MVKIQALGQEYYMDGYLKDNLDTLISIVKKDWDAVLCVDGYEGSGKSVLTQQAAFYVDPTLCIDRICFSANEFRKAITNAKPYQAVVYDEAFTGLDSSGAMSIINRTLKQTIAEIRQKNLYIFVVMPTFFDLQKYIALWRSRALIHVYTGPGFERGYFEFYNQERKLDLFVKGKKEYNYHVGKPNFRGRFTNWYAVNEEEYRLKKKESLGKRENDRVVKEIQHQLEDEIFQKVAAMDNSKMTNRAKAELLGISEQYYYQKLKKFQDKNDI